VAHSLSSPLSRTMTGFAAQHVVGNGMHVSTTLTRRERVFDTESEAGSQRAHSVALRQNKALDPTALLGASGCKHPASPAMLAGQRRD
jgi:hypothetical protein